MSPSVVSPWERTLIYDADCGFCARSATWLAATGSVRIVPWQGIPELGALGLTEEMVTTAAYWVEDGRAVASADAAIGRALIARGGASAVLGRMVLLPGIRLLGSRIYRVIARNRHAMPGGTDSCKLPPLT